MQDKQNNLAAKIASVSGELIAIPRTKKPDATVQYAFRSIDEVMNAINPLLDKYKLVIRIEVLDRKLTPITSGKGTPGLCAEVLINLTVTDGSESLTTQEWAVSIDYSDKAPTQAMSMAYKYALIRLFVVTTKDLVLNDADTRTVEVPAVQQTNNGNNSEKYLKETFLAELNKHGLKAEFLAKVPDYQKQLFAKWSAAIDKIEAMTGIVTELQRLKGGLI